METGRKRDTAIEGETESKRKARSKGVVRE